MKTTLKLFGVFALLLIVVSCSDDENSDNETILAEFTVTAISPASGTVGTEITISGTNFPTNMDDLNLTFGGVTASITSLTATQIRTTVPAGAASGEISIAANGITRTAPTSFTVLSEVVDGRADNIFAPQTGGRGEPIGGAFTKFSFATGAVTESDTEWDIAFRGSTIAVNGGVVTGTNDEPERNGNAAAAIVDGIFNEVVSAAGLNFEQDGNAAFAIPTGSDNGWYNYNPTTNLLIPIPGKVLVFRTHDGKFAKVEILSYYENAPANPDGFADASRYYTFNFVYNPNEGETSLAN